jgi:glycosyltransferase involved in cell wall biosynthesis|tara:strand:+ start:2779 stop:3918 length:1140 start_codon:yes stop_codon:yes gene_type:complete
LSLALILKKNNSKKYNFIFYTTVKENISLFKEKKIDIQYIKITFLSRIQYLVKSSNVIRKFFNFIELKLDSTFKKDDIDLVYFLTQSSLYKYLENYNFIYTLWDLCHRDFPEFPEVSLNNEFNSRDFHLGSLLPKATHILTESDLGKENVINRYSVDEKRVTVLPMIPSESSNLSREWLEENYLSIKDKYLLNHDYIFYPAQFWAHKNHIYILEGLKILKEDFNVNLCAVFSGSDHGNLTFIKNSAKRLGVDELIHFIGFVDDNEIPFLYKQSTALVMPTYFGPTNIPPLEASLYKCPVLYSDLPGLNVQMRHKSLLLDLKQPKSLALNLLKVLDYDKDVESAVTEAYNSINNSDKFLHWKKLKQIFDDYKIVQKTWKA